MMPTTQAGIELRALLEDIGVRDPERSLIPAIEEQAATEARRELLAKVEAAEALSKKVDWFLDRNIYRAYPFEDEARALRAILRESHDA